MNIGLLAGLGQGLQGAQGALATYLAQKQQQEREDEDKRRFQLQFDQGNEQFNANQQLQNQQLEIQKGQFGLQQTAAQQAEAERQRLIVARQRLGTMPGMEKYAPMLDANMQPFETPDVVAAREAAQIKAQQDFTHQENEAQRRNALAIASGYGNRRATPEEQFADRLSEFQVRMASNADYTPEEKMAALRQFVQMGRISGGYKPDAQRTHQFIAPGVDPFVRNRFGGDYNKATLALQTDPVLYAELMQQGVDPDRVTQAIEESVANHNKLKTQPPPAPQPSAPPPVASSRYTPPTPPPDPGNYWQRDYDAIRGAVTSGVSGGINSAQELAEYLREWRAKNAQNVGLR